jgi:hypothetical protein
LFRLGNTTEPRHIANNKGVYLAQTYLGVFQRIEDRLRYQFSHVDISSPARMFGLPATDYCNISLHVQLPPNM